MASKKKTIADLNKIYNDAENVDQSLFAEQRSNCLLASGDHYSKKHSVFWGRIRDSRQLTEETRLRITKNHLHRICNIYVNNIYALAPDVAVIPKNEKELHDQKAAELRGKVWKDWKNKVRFREKVRQYVDDFVKPGEVAVKVFWDPSAGTFLGYEQKVDELGNPQVDEMGQPVAGDRAIFSGDIVIERIFTANLLREATAKEFGEGCWIYRKMVDIGPLQAQYKDTDKESFIVASSKDVYTVFDTNSANLGRSKDQVMIREFYYHPCEEYPEGYYFIATEAGVLEEGPLPYGIYPLIFEGFDEIPTSPRKRSIIKQLRPPQAELNRAASQAAMHQITVGDDKLLIHTGTKVTQAAKLPGVRAYSYAGVAPTVIPGRAGDQFAAYIENQAREMYQIANLEEELVEKGPNGNTDPFAELYKSIRHKKKYVLYAEKIEHFLKRICETVLELARNYYSDEMLAEIFGMDEISNISEFRALNKMSTDYKLEAQGEDAETRMGKQIAISQFLQYVGSKLDKEDIGKLFRVMPFVNEEEILSDYTTDYDNVTNDILALDRGEIPQSNPYDNHKYIIKRLTSRVKQAGFKYLHPQVQQNYMDKINEHMALEEEQLQKIKAMESEFIPSGGYLVGCDFYVTDPENPSRTRRARIPYESLTWLVKQLETQGAALGDLEKLEQGVVSDLAGKMISQMANGGLPPQASYQEPQGRPVSA